MNRPDKPVENTKLVQKAVRAAKLAKALKANIKRRKAKPQETEKP
jgi:hypothetical protein